MKFECPHCHQHLETATLYGGQGTTCPQCGGDLRIPEADGRRQAAPLQEAPSPVGASLADARNSGTAPEGGASSPSSEAPSSWRIDITEIKQALQSSIQRESVTITEYMENQHLEGGVTLDSTDDTTASKVLTDEKGRKYKLGDVVAKGGMGAVINARDHNLRRTVAMKVLLNPKQATKEQVLRFIEEAQVTSQLQHPGIVPIHELGVDASGNVFYTMKFVQGRTLKHILKGIKEGDKATVDEYPLSRLLTIYQRVCDAVAFAHSKRVIHRDLKPENIMIGEYGEVQVMDWGLAKVMPKLQAKRMAQRAKGGKPTPAVGHPSGGGDPEGARSIPGSPPREGCPQGGVGGKDGKRLAYLVDSVRADDGVAEVLKTLDGMIMGTPGFMAPEQALGDTESFSEATDIYALGAILYDILTLQPPITGKTVDEILKKITSGVIAPPTALGGMRAEGENLKPEVSLKHVPGGRVPAALSAVAMKALAMKQEDRYRSIKSLQADIEAYQSGFATSVEHAGTWTQFTLLVKRNKGIFTAIAAALAVILAGSAAFMGKVMAEKNRAERAYASYRAEQENGKLIKKESAPALHDSAKAMIEKGEFGKAEELLRLAREYAPGHVPSAQLLAVLLMKDGKAKEALDLLAERNVQEAAGTAPLLAVAKLAAKGGQPSMGDLAAWASEQGLPALALQFSRSGGELFGIYKAKITKAWPSAQVMIAADGALSLDLTLAAGEVRSLGPLQGLPIRHLTLNKCAMVGDLSPLAGMPLNTLYAVQSGVTDLAPLKGMPLTTLHMSNTRLSDITPLIGMRLTELRLDSTKVTDLAPLRGMPLTSLTINYTAVTDLSPLTGLPLTSLGIMSTPVTRLSPLKGMPLTTLHLSQTGVSDLSPLKGMPLTWIELYTTKVADLSPLRGMSLKMLRMDSTLVTDLSPLRDVPLTGLDLSNTRVKDLSPLKGMPLTRLMALNSGVTDLSPLAGMPLDYLTLSLTGVSDLSPLKGMPLRMLEIVQTDVTDLSPLKGMALASLSVTPERITQGWDVVREMRTLYQVCSANVRWEPTDFFKKLDAGDFKKK